MTDTTIDITTEQLVNDYIAIWNEEDAASRGELIARTWELDGEYVDPLLQGSGHDGIEAMTAGVQSTYPGHKFVRIGAIDQHHDRIRFGWQLLTPEREPLVIGTDYGVVSADGRLKAITGFFEPD
ncbi:MAG TPA: hypothetical protein VFQ54_06630 [Thermomicrobiales bacterium]|nr:hypothetical protein [Thermomicrobiales bacterium]